jgi:hypothetical protein
MNYEVRYQRFSWFGGVKNILQLIYGHEVGEDTEVCGKTV